MVIKKCKICGKEFEARGSAKCCSSECSEINRKEHRKKYHQSEKGKAVLRKASKKYNQSEKGKAAHRISQKKYQQSDKGKATRKRYQQSDKGKAAQKRANQSDKGKAAHRISQKKYKQSNKGKATEKRYRQSNKGKATQKEWYENNRDKILTKQYAKEQEMISELCEQYSGDLEQILEECPHSWIVREAKMRVWFNESYADGMIAKIKSTPVCEVTGEKTNDLVIHHLYSFNTHPELGNDPANMVRVATSVHNEFHRIYGYGNNTPEQWEEFIENY